MQENATIGSPFKKRKVAKEPITAKKLQLTVQDLEDSYHKEHGYYTEEANKQDEDSDDEDAPPIEFNSVEYIVDEPAIDMPPAVEMESKPVIKREQATANQRLEFPLMSQADLDRLEVEIGKPSSTYRRELIETIHTIQGKIKDHKVTVRTFFRVIFHDTLLVHYTWKGFESKKALCQYKNLMTFLKKILVRWYPDDDLSDFSKCIQNYIKNIPARLKNMQAKLEKE